MNAADRDPLTVIRDALEQARDGETGDWYDTFDDALDCLREVDRELDKREEILRLANEALDVIAAKHAAEGERLEQALDAIRHLPKGHDCPGYCRRMYAIAVESTAAGRTP